MYNGPPLPPEKELPFSLLIEFLMAAAAGKVGTQYGHLPWSDTDLEKVGVASRQGIRNILEKFNEGDRIAPKLLATLAENEHEGLTEQWKSAHSLWSAATKEMREDSVRKAIIDYGLPSTWQERQGVFAKWAHDLKSEEARRLRIAGRFNECGFIDMAGESQRARGFKAFLYGGHLPYFSRDSFNSNELRDPSLLSESRIVEKIEASEEPSAILLYGPGGFGKTRLAYQICEMVTSDFSLQIDAAADYRQLRNVLASSEGNGRLLLFQDYAETVVTTKPLRDFCYEIQNELGIISTLILCSRSSGAYEAEMTFSEFEIETYRLDSSYSGNDRNYERWLTCQIANYFDLVEDLDLLDAFHGVPFFAAYAGYLKAKGNKVFSHQFGIENADIDFISWAHRRIYSLSRFGPTSKRRLAEIALALPVRDEELSSIIDDSKGVGEKVFEALEGDYWVEEEGDEYFAIHDVLADALVSEQLFSAAKPEKRLVELLSTACDKEYLRRALHSIRRVSEHPKFQAIDSIDVLLRLEKKFHGIMQQNAFDIVRSVLVPASKLVSVIDGLDSIFEGLKGDKEACQFLSKIVASRLKHSKTSNCFRSNRMDYLLRSASYEADAKVLSNLVWYDPEAYLESATTSLLQSSKAWDDSFLLSAILRNGASLERGGPSAVGWLDRFGEARLATFVFSAWGEAFERAVEAGALTNPISIIDAKISDFLSRWCQRFGDEYFSARMLIFWLEKTGDAEEALEVIEEWLQQHSGQYMAAHIFQALIKYNGFLGDQLWGHIRRWLKLNQADFSTEVSYIFREIRDAGTEIETVSTELFEFIASSAPTKARRDTCCYWLQMGGDPESIQEYLLKILSSNPDDDNVRFVFQSLYEINPSGMDVWRRHMRRWLGSNASHPMATYVFFIWFKMMWDKEPIRGAMKIWLKENSGSKQYGGMLHQYMNEYDDEDKAWPGEVKRDTILLYMNKGAFGTSSAAKIEKVIDYYCIERSNEEICLATEKACQRYFSKYKEKHGCVFLLAKTIIAYRKERWPIDVAASWLSQFGTRHFASRVLQSLVETSASEPWLRLRIENWFAANEGANIAGGLLLASIVSKFGCDSWAQVLTENWLRDQSQLHIANGPIVAALYEYRDPKRWHFAAQKWLVRHQTSEHAGDVLIAWARVGGDTVHFASYAQGWCNLVSPEEFQSEIVEITKLYDLEY
jgi:hypothetical protein